jgi:hypothetical protein
MRQPIRQVFFRRSRVDVLMLVQKQPHSLHEIICTLGAERDPEMKIEVCEAVTFLREKGFIRLNREFKFEEAHHEQKP